MSLEVLNRTCILRLMQCDAADSTIQCVPDPIQLVPNAHVHLCIQSHEEMSMQVPCIRILPSSPLSSFILTPLADLGLVTALDGVDGSS